MKVPAKLKAKYNEYVSTADSAAENLAFLLDNLSEYCVLDFTEESLRCIENVYWKSSDAMSFPDDLGGLTMFEHYLGQYLGMCVIKNTGARWRQSEDRNHLFGQPCIDGFNNEKWDRIYPVDLTTNLCRLARIKPNFPGVPDRAVLATAFRNAAQAAERATRSV